MAEFTPGEPGEVPARSPEGEGKKDLSARSDVVAAMGGRLRRIFRTSRDGRIISSVRRRLLACLGLSSIVLAIVVGDGLTLTRCLLTGRVMLSCCCQTSAPSPSSESTAEEPETCCSFQHLAAGWPTAPTMSRSATLPTFALTDRAPTAAGIERVTSRRANASPSVGEPPPIWRTALRI
jgi:hypothetical protein